MSKPKNKSDIIRYIIMGVALVVFVICAIMLIRIFRNYKEAEINNGNATEFYETKSDSTDTASNETTGENETKAPNYHANAVIDFASLKASAPNVCGWVDVPSVNISYPIVQGPDNDYYLTHAYNDKEMWGGAIFLDYTNNKDFKDDHVFVYGHHMQDGSMFAGLLEYDTKDFYSKQEDAENNYFYIYLEDSVRVYKIFSTCDVNINDNYDAFRYITDAFTLQDYVNYVTSVELYDSGVYYDGTSQVVTLYTCQQDAASGIRHMVHGQLVAVLDPEY